MAPSFSLAPRAANYGAASDSGLPTVVIAGFVVAGVIVLLVASWMGLRWYRKRAATKRDNARGAAFLSVRGLIKEDGSASDPEKASSAATFGGPQFSRAQLTQSVVMPSRAYRADATDAEIIEYHAQTDTLPKPFQFALSASSSPSPTSHSAAPSHGTAPSISIVPETDRRSWRSSIFNAGRSSFLSVSGGRTSSARDSTASTLSFGGSTSGASKRKVRQLFNPVLPDELVLSLSESLTVVHSYDDGWCIVGRESSIFAAAAAASTGSDAFGTHHAQPADKAEMGAVPAWVFVKPVKGLRAERPMRSTSLGVTVELSAPNAPFSSREECVSWSNF